MATFRAAAGALALLLGTALSLVAQTPRPAEENEPLEVGGYFSSRYQSMSAPARSALILRRLVGEVEANRGRFHLETELELEGTAPSGARSPTDREERELDLEQAWLSYAASPTLSIRAGALLPPVGRLNARNEDYLWDYPRRPLIDRAVPVLPARAAWRALGAGVVLDRPLGSGRRLRTEVYALDATRQAFTVERSPTLGASGEAVVQADDEMFSDGGVPRAGAARIALSSAGGAELAVSGQVGRWGSTAGGDATTWTAGVDGVQRVHGFIVEGEALYARYGSVEGVLRTFAGEARAELQPGGSPASVRVDVEGLARARYGFWLDLERPIALPALLGEHAALLVPVLRYEQVRLGDAVTAFSLAGGSVSGLERSERAQERISLGLAFRPLPKVVAHLTAERSRALRGTLLDPAVAATSERALCLGFAVGF